MTSNIAPTATQPTIDDCRIANRELLDLLDSLRTSGFEIAVDLPRLVVFGDQSSGKSSVLEAITRVKFPSKDVVCTRFPLELVLRSASTSSWSAEIVADPRCGEVDRDRFATFDRLVRSKVNDPLQQMDIMVREAEEMMKFGQQDFAFSQSTLRVRLSGPNLIDLDVVDTPGLFHGRGVAQSEKDVPLVRELVESYMSKASTVIVMVISASGDVAGQQVTQLAHQHDREGDRTIGICTKPDRLEGDAITQQFVNLIKNQVIPLQLGWHVLRNRGPKDQAFTDDERDQAEADFFATSPWDKVPARDKGIAQLNIKLMSIYRQHIINVHPKLHRDIAAIVQAKEEELSNLPSNASIANPRDELHNIAVSIVAALHLATTVEARDTQTNLSAAESQLRLRLHQTIEAFKQTMRTRGHRYHVVYGSAGDVMSDDSYPIPVSHTAMVSKVKSWTQPNQLLGQVDLHLSARLFAEQNQPWSGHLVNFFTTVTSILEQCIDAILNRLCSGRLNDAVRELVIQPVVRQVIADTKILAEGQLPRAGTGSTNILNTAANQAVRQAEARYILKTVRQVRAPAASETSSSSLYDYHSALTVSDLFSEGSTEAEALYRRLTKEVDPCEITAYKAVECMLLHYEAELERFLNWFNMFNINLHVLERLKLQITTDTFHQGMDDRIESVLGEAEADRLKRSELTEQITVLKTAQQQLENWMRDNIGERSTNHLKRKRNTQG